MSQNQKSLVFRFQGPETKSAACKAVFAKLNACPLFFLTVSLMKTKCSSAHVGALFAEWDAVDIFDLCVSRAHNSFVISLMGELFCFSLFCYYK